MQRHTNSGSVIAIKTSAITMRSSENPHVRACASTSAMLPRTTATSSDPTMSGNELLEWRSVSTSTRRATNNAGIPITRCTRNALRHPRPSTSADPTAGPIAPATPPTAVHAAIALVAWLAGHAASTNPSDDGKTHAAPRPSMLRPANTCVKVVAVPATNAPTRNRVKPSRNRRRLPVRSPMRPMATTDAAIAIVYVVESHERCDGVVSPTPDPMSRSAMGKSVLSKDEREDRGRRAGEHHDVAGQAARLLDVEHALETEACARVR